MRGVQNFRFWITPSAALRPHRAMSGCGCWLHPSRIVLILAGMEITGLGWCGTRNDRSTELASFHEHVLGLRLVHTESDFWVFELPDGRHSRYSATVTPARSISAPVRSSASLCVTCQRQANLAALPRARWQRTRARRRLSGPGESAWRGQRQMGTLLKPRSPSQSCTTFPPRRSARPSLGNEPWPSATARRPAPKGWRAATRGMPRPGLRP